ncbi:MAG: aminomethyl-transferring glycine dehydrogenase, partial [Bacteroidota bacterium]
MPIDLTPTDRFANRHIGPSPEEIRQMLGALGASTLDDLIDQAVPDSIRLGRALDLPEARTERQLLLDAAALADQNEVFRSYIGMGYSGTVTPPPIQRNILENPSWYTQYTPYQAEIAQGRLEALLNFQTMLIDLTGLEIANASLLDEGTAAAEAMMMVRRVVKKKTADTFFVSEACHPQTIEVVKTRAVPMGVNVVVGDHRDFTFDDSVFGALIQYPTSDGGILDYAAFCEAAHANKALVVAAADLLSLTLLTPPGEFGADVAVGNTQRFGVPMGFGGPHAAYFATRAKYKRQVPGRMIGVSVDRDGNQALRMALQTREQHIRRDKATSNICTAQVLLSIMASMYGVYHGPNGLTAIATRVHDLTKTLAAGLAQQGHSLRFADYFDTLRLDLAELDAEAIRERAEAARINLRYYADGSIGLALDETTTATDLADVLTVFATSDDVPSVADLTAQFESGYAGAFGRTSDFMTHPVFNSYHSETELMRYMHKLSSRDLSLTSSMIALGSCTMKLNAAAELMPVTMTGFNQLHPFAPKAQAKGYYAMFEQLETWLAEITGFAGVSLQPNSGASGEYTGLLTIRAYHEANGDTHRTICLIPDSAHGTNPASAVMAGMK